MQTLLTLFLSMNEPPSEGWKCLATVDTRLKPTVSLPDSLRVDDSNAVYMLMDCKDNAGFSQRDIADGYIWHYGGRLPHHQRSRRSPPRKSGPGPARCLPPGKTSISASPRAHEVTATDLLNDCQRRTDPAKYVLESWKLTSGTCSPDGITLLYQIMPGGTVEGFPARAREVFGVTPVFNLKEGAGSRGYTGSPDSPLKDEAVPSSSTQFIRILSGSSDSRSCSTSLM